jgi:phosphatidylglycerophosphatase A
MTGGHRPRPPARALLDPVHFFALGFGSGLSPVAPGTFGTLAALPLAFVLLNIPAPLAWAVVIVCVLGGIRLTGISADRLGVPDHPAIVWDEIAAFLGLVLVLPAGWAWILAGFVFFRLFDAVKPWPIRDLDHRLKGGLGIMLDDLAAAVFAAGCVWLLNYLITFI